MRTTRPGTPTTVAPGGHRFDDHRTGTDLGPVADGDVAQDDGVGADDDVVADGRMAFDPLRCGAAQDHPLVYQHVIADLGCFTDHNSGAMVDEKPPANLGARMDLDAGEKAVQMREKTAQGQVVMLPEAVADAVQPEGVQAGVAGQHLKGGAGRRILGEHRLDILPQQIAPTAEQTRALTLAYLVAV